MKYDVVIVGAGMSGLAAGIRLAYFEKHVCIVEKHYAFGGLNSYYTLDGRQFDVGLHAVTNYVPSENRSAPLPKLLRQLRLTREDFDLCEQNFSEIRFPDRRLQFSNDSSLLEQEVAQQFPGDVDSFRRLVAHIRPFDDVRLDATYESARKVLADYLRDPLLIEMLLCPLMYYGSPEEHDMDFTQFVTMFKSIFLEGFARPREGVRRIIKTLVKKFRAHGGKLRMNCGVERIDVSGRRVTGLTLESGETLEADVVLSSAGYFETLRMCSDAKVNPPQGEIGCVSFVETIGVLDDLPGNLGHQPAIVFFNDADRFTYAVPDELVDLRSGVICCPSNFDRHDDMTEGLFRVTWLANHDGWSDLDRSAYTAAKEGYRDAFSRKGAEFIPGFADHVVYTDMFTPTTIRRYTGHLNGAV